MKVASLAWPTLTPDKVSCLDDPVTAPLVSLEQADWRKALSFALKVEVRLALGGHSTEGPYPTFPFVFVKWDVPRRLSRNESRLPLAETSSLLGSY